MKAACKGNVILQGFNWKSHSLNKTYYSKIQDSIPMMEKKVDYIWMPPCSKSYHPEGYFPEEYYDLNSEYGTKNELKILNKKLKESNIKSIADIVCWYDFDGFKRPNYTFNNRERDINDPGLFAEFKNYVSYLIEDIGFSGFRLDYIKGYPAGALGQYLSRSSRFKDQTFMVAELWDCLDYERETVCYNQDRHRQDITDYINSTNDKFLAFDFTTKGILQDALYANEYWRLADKYNQPPGVLGWWNDKAIGFIDNHDTLGQHHWPFSYNQDLIIAGYVYILTHFKNACIYTDHFYDLYSPLADLILIHKEIFDENEPEIEIILANDKIYIAKIGKMIVTIGEYCHYENKIFEYSNARIFYA